jgi:recombination protein RecA
MNPLKYTEELKEKYKDEISVGSEQIDCISTGIFSLDRALGGGVPRRKFSLIVGPEGAAKTTLALKVAGQIQKYDWDTGEFGANSPTPVAFIDLEATFNGKWASKHGVIDDPEYFSVIRPGYAEQAVDIINDMLLSSTYGLIILDSIEAMFPKKQQEMSVEDSNSLGERAKLVNNAYRKWTTSLIRSMAANEKTPWKVPTLICLNQLREKIGVMYGNPITLPGGKGQNFYSHTKIELNTPKIADDSTKTFGVGEFHGIVKKTKATIPRQRFSFEMSLKDSFGEPAGYVNNAKAVVKVLKSAGAFVKADKGWEILGVHYAKQDDFQEKLRNDEVFYKTVVDYILSNGMGADADE